MCIYFLCRVKTLTFILYKNNVAEFQKYFIFLVLHLVCNCGLWPREEESVSCLTYLSPSTHTRTHPRCWQTGQRDGHGSRRQSDLIHCLSGRLVSLHWLSAHLESPSWCLDVHRPWRHHREREREGDRGRVSERGRGGAHIDWFQSQEYFSQTLSDCNSIYR